jgi:23S rRNA (cytidine1920-2'-O)/16S rRNA (cytidine1409-2'-O)-methyltransferase
MTAAADRRRLDELLVTRGLASSRSQARALIEAGKVESGGEVLKKPGREYPADTPLTVTDAPRFVSRGGEKLAAFLERFAVSLAGGHVLDVGASTGGFTDCALQAGAASVTCVDVGQGQLHPRLRDDPRVTNREKINARHLTPDDLPRDAYDAVVMDLSFISLRLVLPAVWPFVRPSGVLIALVKPQFEVGKAAADAGRGIIRDPTARQAALDDVTAFALTELAGATLLGTMPSPIVGTDGNHEFLMGLTRSATT